MCRQHADQFTSYTEGRSCLAVRTVALEPSKQQALSYSDVSNNSNSDSLL